MHATFNNKQEICRITTKVHHQDQVHLHHQVNQVEVVDTVEQIVKEIVIRVMVMTDIIIIIVMVVNIIQMVIQVFIQTQTKDIHIIKIAVVKDHIVQSKSFESLILNN